MELLAEIQAGGTIRKWEGIALNPMNLTPICISNHNLPADLLTLTINMFSLHKNGEKYGHLSHSSSQGELTSSWK
jgi:hypothetical protein